MMKQVCAILAAGVLGCATTSTTETTWHAPDAYAAETGRAGSVESVREVVQRVEGNPAGGALLGAVIGGVLTRGPIGAVGGAAVGAAASQGSAERRVYEVGVRFDDGVYGAFRYYGYAPFPPGARVVLTPQGLERI